MAAQTPSPERQARFEREVLPHLDAAYALARWLLRNEHDAQDATQEAVLRALRFFDGYRGENAKAWLLTIVRNTCWNWRRESQAAGVLAGGLRGGEQALETAAIPVLGPEASESPERVLALRQDEALLNRCLEELPAEYREVLVLRELEDLMYKEIAAIVDVPLGTVMSRLSRGRVLLAQALARRVGDALNKESHGR